MRVLVTGAAGQVGTEATRALAGRAEVTALDRAGLDLADGARIATVLREMKPEVVVNAAAYTAVDRAESEPDLAAAINATAPGILAEQCRRLGALLIHFSTDYVFDGTKPTAWVEGDPTAPLGVYGATKLAGERAVAQAGATHLILRTSWVYGPHGANFLRTMLRLGAEREELKVVADQHGAPTSSLQLGRLVGRLLAQPREKLETASGIYHATAAGETTWHGFAAAIFAARPPGPRLVPIATSEWPTPARRPANSRMDCAKLAATFGLTLEPWPVAMREVLAALPG